MNTVHCGDNPESGRYCEFGYFACQWSTLLFLQLYSTRAGGYGSRNFALLFAIGLQQPELLCTCHCQVATLIPMLLGARLSSSYAYFYCSVFAHVSVERFPLTTVR